MEKNRVTVLIILLMKKNMSDNGRKIRNVVKEFYIILLELSMKVNGKAIK